MSRVSSPAGSAPRSTPPHPRPHRIPVSGALAVAVVLSAAGCVGGDPVARPAPRSHVAVTAGPAVTAAAPVTTAPVPARVTRAAWRATVPGLLSLVAAGPGVVARTATGLVALDGSTGHLRWRWNRPGTRTTALLASPDLATVVVALGPVDGARTAGAGVAVLDAATGRVRFTATGGWAARPLQLTDAALVSSDAVPPDARTGDVSGVRPATRYEARSVTDGRLLWTHPVGGGCRALPDDAETGRASFPTASAVVLTTVCGVGRVPVPTDQQTPATARVTALDAATGRARWERDVRVAGSTASAASLGVAVPPDGAVVTLTWLDPRTRRTGVVLRADTGAVLPADPAAAVADGLRTVTRTGIRDATTGAVVSADPAAALCADHGLALAAGVVCVDPLASGAALGAGRVGGRAVVHVGGLTGTPLTVAVDLGGPFYADSGADPVTTMDTPGLFAVPGAVVVAPLLRPLADRPTVLVGLR